MKYSVVGLIFFSIGSAHGMVADRFFCELEIDYNLCSYGRCEYTPQMESSSEITSARVKQVSDEPGVTVTEGEISLSGSLPMKEHAGLTLLYRHAVKTENGVTKAAQATCLTVFGFRVPAGLCNFSPAFTPGSEWKSVQIKDGVPQFSAQDLKPVTFSPTSSNPWYESNYYKRLTARCTYRGTFSE